MNFVDVYVKVKFRAFMITFGQYENTFAIPIPKLEVGQTLLNNFRGITLRIGFRTA